jgi:hypothetical protein
MTPVEIMDGLVESRNREQYCNCKEGEISYFYINFIKIYHVRNLNQQSKKLTQNISILIAIQIPKEIIQLYQAKHHKLPAEKI